MSTASHHRRVRLQLLHFIRLHAPGKSGRSVAGPWALRPKRLRWLTTPAENRQAHGPGAHAPERCGARRSSHCDRPGMLHAHGGHRAIWGPGRSAAQAQNAASLGPRPSRCQRLRSHAGLLRQRSRASAQHSSSKILIGPEARAGTSLPSFILEMAAHAGPKSLHLFGRGRAYATRGPP